MKYDIWISRRFITEDPIKDGLNWYVYTGNNPVNFVDPTGLEVQIWITNIKTGKKAIADVLDQGWRRIGETAELDTYIIMVTSDSSDEILQFEATRDALMENENGDIYIFHYNPSDAIGEYKGLISKKWAWTRIQLLTADSTSDNPIAASLFANDGSGVNDKTITIHIGGEKETVRGTTYYAASAGCIMVQGDYAGPEGFQKFIDIIEELYEADGERGISIIVESTNASDQDIEEYFGEVQ